MIIFKTLNVDGKVCNWEIKNKEELYKEWTSPECWLPANDDPLLRAVIDNEEYIFDNATFEDLLTMVGIDIWA